MENTFFILCGGGSGVKKMDVVLNSYCGVA